jgi:hypothetical protein
VSVLSSTRQLCSPVVVTPILPHHEFSLRNQGIILSARFRYYSWFRTLFCSYMRSWNRSERTTGFGRTTKGNVFRLSSLLNIAVLNGTVLIEEGILAGDHTAASCVSCLSCRLVSGWRTDSLPRNSIEIVTRNERNFPSAHPRALNCCFKKLFGWCYTFAWPAANKKLPSQRCIHELGRRSSILSSDWTWFCRFIARSNDLSLPGCQYYSTRRPLNWHFTGEGQSPRRGTEAGGASLHRRPRRRKKRRT